MIDPATVAEAILDAAVQPTRDKKVGLMASINTAVAKVVPTIADKMSAKQADRQHSDAPAVHPEGALYKPSEAVGDVGRAYLK
jgi:hypothetical protein